MERGSGSSTQAGVGCGTCPPRSLCLISSVSSRDKAPGQRECDYSIDGINRCIRDIEQASLAAVSQSLATRDDISVEVHRGSGAGTEASGRTEESHCQALGDGRIAPYVCGGGVSSLNHLPLWNQPGRFWMG